MSEKHTTAEKVATAAGGVVAAKLGEKAGKLATQAVGGATKAGKKELRSPLARLVLGVVGVVQISFAFLAFWDLWHRSDQEVAGPKPVWIPVILVNWIGPAAYFLFGVKR